MKKPPLHFSKNPPKAMNVGELKKLLKEIPDDVVLNNDSEMGVRVVIYNRDQFEDWSYQHLALVPEDDWDD